MVSIDNYSEIPNVSSQDDSKFSKTFMESLRIECSLQTSAVSQNISPNHVILSYNILNINLTKNITVGNYRINCLNSIWDFYDKYFRYRIHLTNIFYNVLIYYIYTLYILYLPITLLYHYRYR